MARHASNNNTAAVLKALDSACSHFETRIWISGVQKLQVDDGTNPPEDKVVATFSYIAPYYISGFQLEMERSKCKISFPYGAIATKAQLQGGGSDVCQERIHTNSPTWKQAFRSDPGMIVVWDFSPDNKKLISELQDQTTAIPPSIVPRVLCRVILDCDKLPSLAEANQWLTGARMVSNQFLIRPHKSFRPDFEGNNQLDNADIINIIINNMFNEGSRATKHAPYELAYDAVVELARLDDSHGKITVQDIVTMQNAITVASGPVAFDNITTWKIAPLGCKVLTEPGPHGYESDCIATEIINCTTGPNGQLILKISKTPPARTLADIFANNIRYSEYLDNPDLLSKKEREELEKLLAEQKAKAATPCDIAGYRILLKFENVPGTWNFGAANFSVGGGGAAIAGFVQHVNPSMIDGVPHVEIFAYPPWDTDSHCIEEQAESWTHCCDLTITLTGGNEITQPECDKFHSWVPSVSDSWMSANQNIFAKPALNVEMQGNAGAQVWTTGTDCSGDGADYPPQSWHTGKSAISVNDYNTLEAFVISPTNTSTTHPLSLDATGNGQLGVEDIIALQLWLQKFHLSSNTLVAPSLESILEKGNRIEGKESFKVVPAICCEVSKPELTREKERGKEIDCGCALILRSCKLTDQAGVYNLHFSVGYQKDIRHNLVGHYLELFLPPTIALTNENLILSQTSGDMLKLNHYHYQH